MSVAFIYIPVAHSLSILVTILVPASLPVLFQTSLVLPPSVTFPLPVCSPTLLRNLYMPFAICYGRTNYTESLFCPCPLLGRRAVLTDSIELPFKYHKPPSGCTNLSLCRNCRCEDPKGRHKEAFETQHVVTHGCNRWHASAQLNPWEDHSEGLVDFVVMDMPQGKMCCIGQDEGRCLSF